MWADRVGGTRCQAVEAAGMGDAVPPVHIHTLFLGAFSPTTRRISVRAGRRVSRRGRVLLAALESPPQEKQPRQCMRSFNGRLLFDAHPGVPAEDDEGLQRR